MNVTNRTMALDFDPFFKVTPPAPAAYPSLVPKSAEPKGDGVHIVDSMKQNPFNFGKFVFWATGLATGAFNLKIVGWSLVAGKEWLPVTLADILCTLGSTTRSVSADLMVGTIAVNGSLVVANYEIVPADNGIQILKLDLQGMQRIQLVPGTKTSGTVTAVNGGMSGF